LNAKLLGDAYRLTYRLTQQVDRHYYAKVLVLNALLYASWILVAFAGKDLLGQAREALSNDNMRRLVTFCLIQAFGICLVLIEIDPGRIWRIPAASGLRRRSLDEWRPRVFLNDHSVRQCYRLAHGHSRLGAIQS
jgi:hypothetical protein